MRILKKYFKGLSSDQEEKFEALFDLYLSWNSKINLISRKDFNNFYERHVLHSLSIAKILKFKCDESILDVGTGGGFPGIPLAIFFPNVEFTLIDRTKKKIKVIDSIKEDLKIKNIKTIVGDVKNIKCKFDFILGRAVTKMEKFVPLVKKNILVQKDGSGIIYLKGGKLDYEEERFPNLKVFRLKNMFESNFFETKKIIYIPQNDI